MTCLLDASVLIALADRLHTAHDVCRNWISGPTVTGFATCPITQTALLRYVLRRNPGGGADEATAVLAAICVDPRHHFWTDDLEPRELPWNGVVGHRQVTDTYLAALARARGEQIVTLDRGLALLHPDVAHLIDGQGAPR